MNRENHPEGKIRYAVVGLGDLAQVAVLPAFKRAENSELTAIVSGDAEKRKKLGKKYRVKSVFSYEEYDQALSLVDAVYLVVPNHLHHDYAVRAAKTGIHVLCEKPMAVTEEECESMIQAADANGVKLMIAYRLHFEKGNLEAAQLAQSGKLGASRIFSSDFAQQVAEGNIRVTEPVEKGAVPSTTWVFIASMLPAICFAPNRPQSWPAAPTVGTNDSRRSRRCPRSSCVSRAKDSRCSPAASELPISVATQWLQPKAF